MTETDLVWLSHNPQQRGAERCHLTFNDSGGEVTGIVVADLNSEPADVRYRITTDPRWRTRTVTVDLHQLRHQARLDLERDPNGRWSINGRPAPSLDGCHDVDLGITPASNTLPIRRLNLSIGEHADIDVAWVRFPELEVTRARQRYTRRASNRWNYQAGSISVGLTVDDEGLVITYGDDLWHRTRQFPA